MRKGKVKFFNVTKGFGFIIDKETKEEIFVHATKVVAEQPLKENDEVVFDTEQDKRGVHATQVDLA